MKKRKNPGEKPEVTPKINEAKFNADFAPVSEIVRLTPELKTLHNIRIIITKAIEENQPIPKIKNLYHLTYSTNLMTISHKKLSKNKGATTPGSESESVETFSIEKMKCLSIKLENKHFKWSKIKQIRIPRKNKKPRPLGLPNYSERKLSHHFQSFYFRTTIIPKINSKRNIYISPAIQSNYK